VGTGWANANPADITAAAAEPMETKRSGSTSEPPSIDRECHPYAASRHESCLERTRTDERPDRAGRQPAHSRQNSHGCGKADNWVWYLRVEPPDLWCSLIPPCRLPPEPRERMRRPGQRPERHPCIGQFRTFEGCVKWVERGFGGCLDGEGGWMAVACFGGAMGLPRQTGL